MLRLQYEEHDGKDIHYNEYLVNHPRAYLVVVTAAQEVYRSGYRDKQDKSQCDEAGRAGQRVEAYRIDPWFTYKLVVQQKQIVCKHAVTHHEPVWRDKSDDRCPEHTPAESHQFARHEHPDEGHEEEYLLEEDACHAKIHEGMEHPPGGVVVLITCEKLCVEAHKAQLHQHRRPVIDEEGGAGGEHKKRARHHAAVYADERVAVVQHHHHECRDGDKQRLDVWHVAMKAADSPYRKHIYHRYGQREAAFGNPVL